MDGVYGVLFIQKYHSMVPENRSRGASPPGLPTNKDCGVDRRTEGENWLLNNRRAGLGITPRYHMSGVERGDDSVLFLSEPGVEFDTTTAKTTIHPFTCFNNRIATIPQSASQPAYLSTEYPFCTSQSMHVIPTTPLLPNPV